MRAPLSTVFSQNADRRLTRCPQLTVVGCAVAWLIISSTVGASTLRVNSSLDTHEDGRLTLREAIAQSSAGDTVAFDVAEVLLTQGEIQIAHDLVIDGGEGTRVQVRRSGGGDKPKFRIFNVIAGRVTMRSLEISNGMDAPPDANVPARGGGIFNAGDLILTRCTFDDNHVVGGTPAGTIPPLPAGGAGQGGDIYNKGRATVDGCTFSTVYGSDAAGGDGAAPGGAGGPGEGGAIYNDGTMTINRSRLRGRAQGGTGGAGSPATANGGPGGIARGGICFNNGQMLVTNSTFYAGVANGGGGGTPAVGGTGGKGGDAQGGGFFDASRLTLVNATLNSNMASGGGGALGGAGTTKGNSGSASGGGMSKGTGGSVTTYLINSIVAGNFAPAINDVSGTVSSGGHNLIGTAGDSSGWTTTDQLGSEQTPISANLGPLRDHGGPTETMLLEQGSRAIDAADNSVTAAPYNLTNDQRLLPRKLGTRVDIGAAEFDPSQPPPQFVVTTTDYHDDGTCGVTDCTLRDALDQTNANADNNTITFAPTVSGTIELRQYPGVLEIYRPVTITGPGAGVLAIDGKRANHIVSIRQHTAVTISGLTLTGGRTAITNAGSLTASDCLFTHNGSPGFGGAIYNDGTFANAQLTLFRCTLSGNSAVRGGGIYNRSSRGSHGTVSLTNCTLSGNSAERDGGAIYNLGTSNGTSSFTLTNCTLTGNTGTQSVGGIYNDAQDFEGEGIASVAITNTILNGNPSGGVTIFNDSDSHGGGQITSHGANISSDNGGGFLVAAGDRPNTNPKLDPAGLRDNGGLTPTIALQSDSPAIDTGNDSSAPPSDQRGLSRVGRSDIGAFEFQGIGPSPTAAPSPTPNPSARSLNISTRLNVLTDDNALIGGFIITGSDNKRVLLRAIGPSVPVDGRLVDPILELYFPDGTVLTNDNWKIDDRTGQSQEASVRDTTIPPPNDLESALVQSLSPGAYTAIVRGRDGGTGIGLVEAYDLDQAAPAQLANISSRGFVETGNNVMIGGFIVGPHGASSTKIAVRAIGASLPVSNALQDPTVQLHDANGERIAFNDNWEDDIGAAEIQATNLAPNDARESALLRTLVPGAYTATVAGRGDTTGVSLVEVYNLQ